MGRKRDMSFYEIDQCALYRCKSKKKLAKLLKTTPKELHNISSKADTSYYQFSQPKKHSNELRIITAPNLELKTIQARILSLLKKIKKPEWIISATLKKSHLSNSQYHKESNYFCKTDIKKFYDNCTRDRVYRFFKDRLETSSDVAKILTDLTTRNNIPTGCPSSQLIAYFAYEEMFKRIKYISDKYHCRMSLYVDDMVFSSRTPFDHQHLMSEVNIEIRRYNHKLKLSKTKYYSQKSGVPITGVILKNHQQYIPNNIRQGIIQDFHQIKKYSEQPNKEQLASLKGKVNAARLIEQSHFNGINSYLKQQKNISS